MATNKNNVDTEKNNLFVLSGDQEEKTPFEYDGMPEFEQDKKEDYAVIKVRFRNYEDVREFASKIGQNNITDRTKAIWYPALTIADATLSRWIDDDNE
tara:strand:+ start:215 stop:508 length:294 start_codon:yes stop_codon:yes gene_type:complete